MESYRDTRIIVLGAGVSGRGVAQVLARHGAHVIVSDKAPLAEDADFVAPLEALGVRFVCGSQDIALLDDADLVVVSPGIPLTIPFIVEAERRGIPCVSEIEIAYQLCQAPILGVTGTNGKTTTTMLLGAVMRAAGLDTRVGGNIGDALSEEVTHVGATGVVVAELSSYQLEGIRDFRTHGAILLNVTPDHLQRHKTMEAYQAAKENIFRNQTSEDVTVLVYEDERVRGMAERIPGQVWYASQTIRPVNGAFCENGQLYVVRDGVEIPLLPASEIPLRGSHNVDNVLAVAALAHFMGLDTGVVANAIRHFGQVPHRIEYVASVKDIVYYNDSKATNTDAVRKALESFTTPVILILGGNDKMEDLTTFMPFVKGHVKGVVYMGAAGARFAEEGAACGLIGPIVYTMAEAIAAAQELASPGDTILLSPACSSFDQYNCFEERGDDFKRQVLAYKGAQTE